MYIAHATTWKLLRNAMNMQLCIKTDYFGWYHDSMRYLYVYHAAFGIAIGIVIYISVECINMIHVSQKLKKYL